MGVGAAACAWAAQGATAITSAQARP